MDICFFLGRTLIIPQRSAYLDWLLSMTVLKSVVTQNTFCILHVFVYIFVPYATRKSELSLLIFCLQTFISIN